MRRNDDRQATQQVIPVRDRAAEVGINLNTIFTACILAGILGLWNSVETMKDILAKNATTTAVIQKEQSYMYDALHKHIEDKKAHR